MLEISRSLSMLATMHEAPRDNVFPSKIYKTDVLTRGIPFINSPHSYTHPTMLGDGFIRAPVKYLARSVISVPGGSGADPMH